MTQKDILTTPNVKIVDVISELPRSPEDFRGDVKIYITGVPIDFSLEAPRRVVEFRNLLTRAKTDLWPVYVSSSPEYSKLLTPDGWRVVEEMAIKVTQIEPDSRMRQEWLDGVVNETIKLAQASTVPIILLRPGSPRIGDVPADNILKWFQAQPEKIEVLDAKSGPDIVGDFAERSFGLSGLLRHHIAGTQILDLENPTDLTGKLILIRSLDKFYKDGATNLFKTVVEKLIELGMGEKQVYIKSPKSDGEVTTISQLIIRMGEFNPADHYTLAVLNL